MNMKLSFALWTVVCVGLGILGLTASFSDAAERTYYSYPPWGGVYTSVITSKMLDSSPDWNDAEANPPLPARKALTLADEATFRATKKGKIDPVLERKLAGLRLVPLGGKKWCWEVSYEWHTQIGGETGNPYEFRVFILMNGKVVQFVEGKRGKEENREVEESKGDG